MASVGIDARKSEFDAFVRHFAILDMKRDDAVVCQVDGVQITLAKESRDALRHFGDEFVSDTCFDPMNMELSRDDRVAGNLQVDSAFF